MTRAQLLILSAVSALATVAVSPAPIASTSRVGSAISFVDYVKRVHRAMTADDAALARNPIDRGRSAVIGDRDTDLQLARGSTGFSVAVRLGDFDVPCLFVSGKAPAFPMPDLALGCLMKPFTAEDVHRSLSMAEDMMRGRETLRPKLPRNLTLYDTVIGEEAQYQQAFIPSRRSLKTRLEHWIAGHQH